MRSEAKPRKCSAPGCEREFWPRSTLHRACSQRCAMKLIKGDKRAVREADKQRREALERLPELKAKAQRVANKYARYRDLLSGKSCISCGSLPAQKRGGTMDGGHFRSVGSAPHLRFYLPQIRLQCVRCNRDLQGNVVEFRKGLVAERGREWVEWLESLYFTAKHTKEWLRRFVEVIGKRAHRFEKRWKAQQEG